jgi:ethanolamine utilization microcompartment shell protein EutS
LGLIDWSSGEVLLRGERALVENSVERKVLVFLDSLLLFHLEPDVVFEKLMN